MLENDKKIPIEELNKELMLACYQLDYDRVRWAIDQGANVNVHYSGSDSPAYNKIMNMDEHFYLNTPLIAAQDGCCEPASEPIMCLLLDSGAVASGESLSAMLHNACCRLQPGASNPWSGNFLIAYIKNNLNLISLEYHYFQVDPEVKISVLNHILQDEQVDALQVQAYCVLFLNDVYQYHKGLFPEYYPEYNRNTKLPRDWVYYPTEDKKFKNACQAAIDVLVNSNAFICKIDNKGDAEVYFYYKNKVFRHTLDFSTKPLPFLSLSLNFWGSSNFINTRNYSYFDQKQNVKKKRTFDEVTKERFYSKTKDLFFHYMTDPDDTNVLEIAKHNQGSRC